MFRPGPCCDCAASAAAPVGRGRVPGAAGGGAGACGRRIEIPIAAPVGVGGNRAPSIDIAPGRVQVLATIVVAGPVVIGARALPARVADVLVALWIRLAEYGQHWAFWVFS